MLCILLPTCYFAAHSCLADVWLHTAHSWLCTWLRARVEGPLTVVNITMVNRHVGWSPLLSQRFSSTVTMTWHRLHTLHIEPSPNALRSSGGRCGEMPTRLRHGVFVAGCGRVDTAYTIVVVTITTIIINVITVKSQCVMIVQQVVQHLAVKPHTTPPPPTQNVSLEGCLLKPQMVISGSEYPGPRPLPEEVAHHTLTLMRQVVPPAIPGIMFLSGGQSEEVLSVWMRIVDENCVVLIQDILVVALCACVRA